MSIADRPSFCCMQNRYCQQIPLLAVPVVWYILVSRFVVMLYLLYFCINKSENTDSHDMVFLSQFSQVFGGESCIFCNYIHR